ncbi:unnamed protein product, partial [Bubo scandiacus]
ASTFFWPSTSLWPPTPFQPPLFSGLYCPPASHLFSASHPFLASQPFQTLMPIRTHTPFWHFFFSGLYWPSGPPTTFRGGRKEKEASDLFNSTGTGGGEERRDKHRVQKDPQGKRERQEERRKSGQQVEEREGRSGQSATVRGGAAT